MVPLKLNLIILDKFISWLPIKVSLNTAVFFELRTNNHKYYFLSGKKMAFPTELCHSSSFYCKNNNFWAKAVSLLKRIKTVHTIWKQDNCASELQNMVLFNYFSIKGFIILISFEDWGTTKKIVTTLLNCNCRWWFKLFWYVHLQYSQRFRSIRTNKEELYIKLYKKCYVIE